MVPGVLHEPLARVELQARTPNANIAHTLPPRSWSARIVRSRSAGHPQHVPSHSRAANIWQIPHDTQGRTSSQVWQHQRVRFSLRDSCWLALLVVLLLHCPLSAVGTRRDQARAGVVVLRATVRAAIRLCRRARAGADPIVSRAHPASSRYRYRPRARAMRHPMPRWRSAYGPRLDLRGWTWS